MKRALLLTPLLLALVAAAPASFRPGLWEIRNVPGQATLDGRALSDLPLGEIKTDRVCMSAADAAKPDQWLARDLPGCTLSRSSFAGGKIDVVGVCPAAGDAQPGKLTLTGRWAADSFNTGFTTLVRGGNGLMGFRGTMTGKRVGECPA